MRRINRLSSAWVRSAKPGMHCDGGGLYLQSTLGADGTIRKSWLFRYALNGRERQMGLGSIETVGLADARQRALDARQLCQQGIDPIEERERQRASRATQNAKVMTLDQCRDAYIAAHHAAWKSARHGIEWKQTLTAYVTPIFGKLPVQAVEGGLILKALEPIWNTKTATASRVRGRIEAILDWATVRGHRSGENPARWRGHLDKLLPTPSKVSTVRHHPALPYAEIGAFMTELRARDALSARALEFVILTATRTGESLGARWDEIDLSARVWTVPAARMKGNKEHRVPLSDAAVAVLRQMAEIRESVLVFPGHRRSTLNYHSLHNLLDRMGRGDLTAHGFRSTFRDWAAECTNFPNHVVEMALAHSIGDAVEAAYRRGDLFDKRRKLMDAWAAYCEKPTGTVGKVVPLQFSRALRDSG